MALKVWLPLNGDLRNQGCSDITVPTYNNLTLVSNGKIGQCYSGQAVYHLTNELLGNVWSLCAWIKADEWYSSNNIILCKNVAAGDAYQFYFSVVGGTQLRIGINNNSGITFNYTFNTGTWYHVAATYDGSIGNLYINGELKKSSSVSNAFSADMNNIGINCRSSNADGTARWIGNSSVHYINDARIYDHCLSAAEVKEISQGLVLHYKLNDITNGIQDSSGYGHNGIITGNIQIAANSGRYSNCIYIPSGNTDYITTNDEVGNFSSGITMNIWFKSSCTTPGSDYHEIFNIATATQNFENAIHKTGYYRSGMHINGSRNVQNTAALDIVNGNWHMLTITYDNTVVRRYVDGIERVNSSVSGTVTSTSCKFLLGHYGTNTSYYAKEAYLSDARIYCTALSANDIKQLYELGAKVDNKQNIHVFELNEIKDILQKEVATLSTSGTSNSQVIANYSVTGPRYPTTRYNQIYCPTNTFVTEQVPIKTGVEYSVTITGPKIFNITYNYSSSRWVMTSSGWISVQDSPTYGMYVGYKIQAQFYDDEGDMVYTQSFNDTYIHQTNRSSSYNQTLYTYGDQTHTIIVPIKKTNLVSVRIAVTCCGSTNVRPTGKIYLLTHKNKIYKTGEFTAMYFKENTNAKIYNDTSVEAAEFVEF